MRRLLAAAFAALLVAAPPAAAKVVAAKPGLKPAFASGTPDYVVHCRSKSPVKLKVDPPDGTRVQVNGHAPRSRPFELSVQLYGGKAMTLRFKRSSGTRTYTVRCLPSDFPHYRSWRDSRPQAGWYLVTPNAKPDPFYSEAPAYAAIFDTHGVPVWWYRRAPGPFAADLLPNGHLVWTGYVGLSPTSGSFEERKLDGSLVHEWKTVGWGVNQHDFKLLPNGDALMITYPPRHHVDMSPWGGSSDDTVMDGEIQEITPEGQLVWRWSTKDHVALSEADRWLRDQVDHPTVVVDEKPWYDVAHVNSVDVHGRLLVFSARFLDAVYGIDRDTGAVLWKLGGKHTPQSLKIEGDRYHPHDFGGQHDARLQDDGRTLTLYDNATKRSRPARALAFDLDLAHRRAKLLQDIRFPNVHRSVCCGSARLLPGGHWVIDWGNTSWVTELKPSGEPVMRLHFERGLASYRAIPIRRGDLSREALHRGMDAMAEP